MILKKNPNFIQSLIQLFVFVFFFLYNTSHLFNMTLISNWTWIMSAIMVSGMWTRFLLCEHNFWCGNKIYGVQIRFLVFTTRLLHTQLQFIVWARFMVCEHDFCERTQNLFPQTRNSPRIKKLFSHTCNRVCKPDIVFAQILNRICFVRNYPGRE